MPGDYALLYGNGGSGDIDYDTPLLNGRKFNLFPMDGGIFGFGQVPFGGTPFGQPFSSRMSGSGFGLMPFGLHPFGLASAIISAGLIVTECGSYKFAFKCFDKLGNVNVGAPEEIEVEVHTAPPAPAGLRKVSYDKDTDILILEAA